MCKLAAVSKKCKKNTVLWRNTSNFKGILIRHICGKTPAFPRNFPKPICFQSQNIKCLKRLSRLPNAYAISRIFAVLRNCYLTVTPYKNIPKVAKHFKKIVSSGRLTGNWLNPNQNILVWCSWLGKPADGIPDFFWEKLTF